jgi:phytoene desaturase
MPDPSRLVSVPSVDDPTLAPPGCSTIYVLEPVPNLTGQVDWIKQGPAMRERLQEFLARQGYLSEIVTEEFVTPLDWRRLGMAAGTPFASPTSLRLVRSLGP